MPRSSKDSKPYDYVVDGTWPGVRLAADAPPSAYGCLLLARDLKAVMEASGLSLRNLAELAGVAHSTIARVLCGEVLCDIGTLARLEAALNRRLWPGPDAVRAAASESAGVLPDGPRVARG